MRILVVEDSTVIALAVARGLRQAGFTVDVVHDGEAALDAAHLTEFDVVILDIMLPKVDGLEVLRQLRQARSRSKILILSARVSIPDRVAGLQAGADDYLIKPFAFEELLARVRVLIRDRYQIPASELRFANLTIDVNAQKALVLDREVALRPREFALLQYLAMRQGALVSRADIFEHIYDHAADLRSNAIDSAICNLRKELKQAGAEVTIRTVTKKGYTFTTQISADPES